MGGSPGRGGVGSDQNSLPRWIPSFCLFRLLVGRLEKVDARPASLPDPASERDCGLSGGPGPSLSARPTARVPSGTLRLPGDLFAPQLVADASSHPGS